MINKKRIIKTSKKKVNTRKMGEKNYIGLARFKAFIRDCQFDIEVSGCIEEIFQDSNINCQIPATTFFKLEEPEIIGCTALHLALQSNVTNSFEQLLNRGACFTIKNDKGMTVLHRAIEHSHNKSKKCWQLKGQLTHPRASLVLSAHIKNNIWTNPCDDYGMSHFHIACMLDHTKAVQFFLDGGVSVNEAITENSTKLPGYTPLHIAARYCCFKTTQLLLHRGADKNSRDARDMTPLHLLLERRMEIMDHMLTHKRAAYDFFKEELDQNEKIVKLFLETQDCNAIDSVGLSGLQVACTLQDTTLVEKFLEHAGDLDHSIKENSSVWPGYTALHFSVHCNFETVRLLLSRGANVLAKDARGVTPFDLCLERRDAESIHVLLTEALHQLNLDELQFSDGKTRLMDLVYAMRSEGAFGAFLLASLKDVNVFIPRDSPLWPGYTPIHLAAIFLERTNGIQDLYDTTDYVEEECAKEFYNCDVIDEIQFAARILILLQLGADVTICNVNGSTPVHLAFPLKSQSTFDWLLSNQGKILNPVDERGFSHMHIACATRHQPFVERVLAVFGNCINDQTTSGFEYRFVDGNERKIRRFNVDVGSTLMHVAVAACDFAMIETLLMHNPDIYVQDSLGMTPIHLSLKSSRLHHDYTEYWRFRELLFSVENLADRVTDFGLSHLHVASYFDDANAITKLLDSGANIETAIEYKPLEGLSFLASYDLYTPLHMATHKESERAREVLAKRGADCLAKEPNGAILFHRILKYNYERFPSRGIFLRKIKSDTTMQTKIFENFGLSTLHLACIANDVDWVEELLNNGANPNALTNENLFSWSGCSPLHLLMFISYSGDKYAAQRKITELLLERGGDVMLTNLAGNTAVHELFHIFYSEGCDEVELLLKYQKDYSVNPTNSEGVSHFHAACITGNLIIVEEFLKHGVDVNLKIGYFPSYYGGYTPLHLAVYHKLGDTIDLLLKYGGDINARDRLGKTPLHTAARDSLDFENLFDRLVDAGADVHARTLLGSTVLEELTWIPSNSTEIELLSRRRLRVNSFNPLTQQGLIGLSLYRDTEDLTYNSFYEAVIEASDANDFDDMGRTPLHNVVSCYDIETAVEAIGGLLKIGYDIDHRDKQGRSALHCAFSFCNKNGIIGLLDYGADINVTDNNNQTAFQYFLKRRSGKTEWEVRNTEDIINIFVKHIYKLNLLNFSVNVFNIDTYIKMIQKVDLNEQVRVDCQNELEKMKKRIFNPLSISLFDFLSSETRVVAVYPNMHFSQRQAIKTFFETDQNFLRRDYPQLSCLLYIQYRKALSRIDLVESAKYSLNYQIGFYMPDLCLNIVFGFLTNEDLKNLISSNEYCQPRKFQT